MPVHLSNPRYRSSLHNDQWPGSPANTRKGGLGRSTRNGIGKWTSDCEARSQKQEDVRQLHVDGGANRVETPGVDNIFFLNLRR